MKTITRLESTDDLIEVCAKHRLQGDTKPSMSSGAMVKLIRGFTPLPALPGTLGATAVSTPDKIVLVDATGAFEFEDTLENFLNAVCQHFDLPPLQK